MNTILLDARDPQTPAVAAELIRRGPAGWQFPLRQSTVWAPMG